MILFFARIEQPLIYSGLDSRGRKKLLILLLGRRELALFSLSFLQDEEKNEDEHRAPVAARPVYDIMVSRRERALYRPISLPAFQLGRMRACARTRAMLLAE